MLSEASRALQEKERLLFLPDKDSANEKAQTLWTVSPQLPCPLHKAVLFLSCPCSAGTCRVGSPWWPTPSCNSLLILNKLIFAEEIVGSLFVPDQPANMLFHTSQSDKRPLWITTLAGTHSEGPLGQLLCKRLVLSSRVFLQNLPIS